MKLNRSQLTIIGLDVNLSPAIRHDQRSDRRLIINNWTSSTSVFSELSRKQPWFYKGIIPDDPTHSTMEQ